MIKITIYVINGYSPQVGQWDLEAYTDFNEARKAFNEYIYEYGAVETGENFADTKDGNTKFWIDEIEINLNVDVNAIGARVTT